MLQLQERLEGHIRSKGEGVRVGRHSFMFGLGESLAFAQSKRDDVKTLQNGNVEKSRQPKKIEA